MTELNQETLARLTFVIRRGPSTAEVGPSFKPVGPIRSLLPDGTESDPKAYAMYELVEGLTINFCLDFPTHMASVTPEGLESLGLSVEDALLRALQNLQSLYGSLTLSGIDEGLFVVQYESPEYAPSFVLHDGVWAWTRQNFPAGMGFSVPTRTEFLLADATNASAMKRLGELTQELSDQVDAPHRGTDIIYRYLEGRMQRF